MTLVLGYATADTMLILLKLATDVCGPPPAVPNSKVAFPSLAVNTVATYTCNAGYNLIGKATARCLSDGKREAPAFSCKSKSTKPDVESPYWIARLELPFTTSRPSH